jgi:hypothetical protein
VPPLEPFLTAYDPSDLPAYSIDPLGFDRGYGFLADKILPGLTNVADQPRYFSLLCGGVCLAADVTAATSREQAAARRDVVLRLERLWALANVLAEHESRPTLGLRGVLRTQEVARALREQRAKRASVDFQILSRQERYGVIGIYGNVADELRLLDRKALVATPDLGDRLGVAFIQATEMPPAVRRAALKGEDASLDALKAWGERAHVSGAIAKDEARCLGDALHRDPVRTRTVELLNETPPRKRERELARLRRIMKRIEDDDERRDLYESLRCIVAFEACYAQVLLAFERMIWRCRNEPSAAVTSVALAADPVISAVDAQLPPLVHGLADALEEARTEGFRRQLGRLDDVVAFLRRAGAGNTGGLVHALLQRHEDVQRGKWDQGRPKLPWIRKHQGRIALTIANPGTLQSEPVGVHQIAPHPYRCGTADALSHALKAA